MKVLIACEYSGITRDAFAAKGHDAWSCDILPTERPGNHIMGDVLEVINQDWDLVIGHPPCTYLSGAGLHICKREVNRVFKLLQGAEFFMQLYTCKSDKVCIENPVGIMSNIYRQPDQIIHPYYFGEPEMKRTCLWLRGLPKLVHHDADDLFSQATHADKPEPIYIDKLSGKKRYFTDAISGGSRGGHRRSKSFVSIAQAMAEQWG
jgi:site-specific DNA-cytosine methylase